MHFWKNRLRQLLVFRNYSNYKDENNTRLILNVKYPKQIKLYIEKEK